MTKQKSKVDLHIHGRATRHGQGGWGATYHNHRTLKTKAMFGGAIRNASDELMEIMSFIHPVGCLKRPCDITLYTESKLLNRIINEAYLPKEHKTLALEIRYHASVHDINVVLLEKQDEKLGGNPKVYNLVHEGIQDAKERFRLNRGMFHRVANHF